MDNAARNRRRALDRSWAEHAANGSADTVRPEVRSSWARSAHAVSPEIAAAPIVYADDAVRRFLDTPLGYASRAIFEDLKALAADGDLMAAITDTAVTIGWATGGRTMSRRAERVHFTAGACWAEAAVGTNALALARDSARPAVVFSSEHYAPMVHDWVCYSAPIRDPVSGRVLGVLDLSTAWNRAHPAMLTTVSALARCVEHELAAATAPGHRGEGTVPGPADGPPGPAPIELGVLGAASCRVGGVAVAVSRRQIELLSVLALHPEGLTLDEVMGRVYGDQIVSPSTVKAELSHLRHALGGRVGSRPYRLLGPVGSDLGRVVDALAAGDLPAAIHAYRGPLLPASSSPEIEMWRNHLEVTLRGAVLAARDGALIRALSERCWYDDELQRAALGSLTTEPPRR